MSGSAARAAVYGNQLEEAARFLKENDDFLVVSHIQPDGDAASSTVAIGLLLEQLQKNFLLINEGSVPRKLSFLPKYSEIVNLSENPAKGKFKHIISVDCADYSRIGSVASMFTEDAIVLNIDHHPTNDEFGAVNLIRTDAAATVEILYDLFQEMKLNWNVSLATAIYTGLLTDTGGFRYSNTTSHVMNIAAEMLRLGVNGHELANELLEKSSLAHILLLKKALSTLAFTEDKQIAWVMVTAADMKDSNATNEDFEGIVNYPRNIEGVEVGLLFKETGKDTYKVGFRSAGKADVAVIAKSFGGGGHVRAAGATVQGPLEQVIQEVVNCVRSALE
ncbi:DHH family phosphoesterase [Paenibacillus gansuensis]|uniref:Bifunctional oligoribonuclease/PAP phosphatase NrnA n=1 Tax=Paenibacillus gansuensis TaxID=306542 RepID=A0ABW5PCR4_9BACL